MGALLTPKAETVTWTVPVLPGVQTVKVASQRPAQATPFVARFSISVLLDWKVNVGLMAEPASFCAAAVKVRTAPT